MENIKKLKRTLGILQDLLVMDTFVIISNIIVIISGDGHFCYYQQYNCYCISVNTLIEIPDSHIRHTYNIATFIYWVQYNWLLFCLIFFPLILLIINIRLCVVVCRGVGE